MGQRSESVKAVFDTNVLISALGWNGKPEECLKKVFDNSITGYTSPEILRELALVMDYPPPSTSENPRNRDFSARSQPNSTSYSLKRQ
jgi:predicted nucleic acid-binding protein